MKETYEISLSKNEAIDQMLFVDPLKRDLGSDSDIEFETIRLRIGRRPSAKNLYDYYMASGQEIPDEYALYTSYNIFLISLTAGLMDEGGWKKVKQLGVQIEYEDDPRVTILELLPQTEFVQMAAGQLKSQTDLSLNGTASLPNVLIKSGNEAEVLSCGAEIQTTNSANMAANLSFSVMTSTVIATGVGDHNAEWLFKKDKTALVGDQTVVHTLLVPRYIDELKLKARLYATVSGFGMLPVKLKGEWVDLDVELE